MEHVLALLEGEERLRLLRVADDRDDDVVEVPRGPLDDVEVTEGDRVEGTRAECGGHGAAHSSSTGRRSVDRVRRRTSLAAASGRPVPGIRAGEHDERIPVDPLPRDSPARRAASAGPPTPTARRPRSRPAASHPGAASDARIRASSGPARSYGGSSRTRSNGTSGTRPTRKPPKPRRWTVARSPRRVRREVAADRVDRPGVPVDERGAGRAPRQGLDAERAAARVAVEHDARRRAGPRRARRTSTPSPGRSSGGCGRPWAPRAGAHPARRRSPAGPVRHPGVRAASHDRTGAPSPTLYRSRTAGGTESVRGRARGRYRRADAGDGSSSGASRGAARRATRSSAPTIPLATLADGTRRRPDVVPPRGRAAARRRGHPGRARPPPPRPTGSSSPATVDARALHRTIAPAARRAPRRRSRSSSSRPSHRSGPARPSRPSTRRRS